MDALGIAVKASDAAWAENGKKKPNEKRDSDDAVMVALGNALNGLEVAKRGPVAVVFPPDEGTVLIRDRCIAIQREALVTALNDYDLMATAAEEQAMFLSSRLSTLGRFAAQLLGMAPTVARTFFATTLPALRAAVVTERDQAQIELTRGVQTPNEVAAHFQLARDALTRGRAAAADIATQYVRLQAAENSARVPPIPAEPQVPPAPPSADTSVAFAEAGLDHATREARVVRLLETILAPFVSSEAAAKDAALLRASQEAIDYLERTYELKAAAQPEDVRFYFYERMVMFAANKLVTARESPYMSAAGPVYDGFTHTRGGNTSYTNTLPWSGKFPQVPDARERDNRLWSCAKGVPPVMCFPDGYVPFSRVLLRSEDTNALALRLYPRFPYVGNTWELAADWSDRVPVLTFRIEYPGSPRLIDMARDLYTCFIQTVRANAATLKKDDGELMLFVRLFFYPRIAAPLSLPPGKVQPGGQSQPGPYVPHVLVHGSFYPAFEFGQRPMVSFVNAETDREGTRAVVTHTELSKAMLDSDIHALCETLAHASAVDTVAALHAAAEMPHGAALVNSFAAAAKLRNTISASNWRDAATTAKAAQRHDVAALLQSHAEAAAKSEEKTAVSTSYHGKSKKHLYRIHQEEAARVNARSAEGKPADSAALIAQALHEVNGAAVTSHLSAIRAAVKSGASDSAMHRVISAAPRGTLHPTHVDEIRAALRARGYHLATTSAAVRALDAHSGAARAVSVSKTEHEADTSESEDEEEEEEEESESSSESESGATVESKAPIKSACPEEGESSSTSAESEQESVQESESEE